MAEKFAVVTFFLCPRFEKMGCRTCNSANFPIQNCMY